MDCGYSLEPPRRGEYEKYDFFYLKNCQFLEVKFSIYWNRHVFVMYNLHYDEVRGDVRNMTLTSAAVR